MFDIAGPNKMSGDNSPNGTDSRRKVALITGITGQVDRSIFHHAAPISPYFKNNINLPNVFSYLSRMDHILRNY